MYELEGHMRISTAERDTVREKLSDSAWKRGDQWAVSELWFNPDSIGTGWWPSRGYFHQDSRGTETIAVEAWMPMPAYKPATASCEQRSNGGNPE